MIVDIVMLHYGDLKTTTKCIDSVLKQSNSYRKIIIINNDNRSDLNNHIKDKKIKIVNSKKNVGFAKGVNKGVRLAISGGADAVLLLNNDTTIKPGVVNNLKKTINKESVGIATPVVKYQINGKKLFDHGGYVKRFWGSARHDNRSNKSHSGEIEVDYVSVCMLVNSEVFNKIGYLDESFFLYYEDLDFCIRAKQSGYKIVVNTKIPICHESNSRYLNKTTVFNLLKSSKIFYYKYFKLYPFGYLMLIRDIIVFNFKSPKFLPITIKALLS